VGSRLLSVLAVAAMLWLPAGTGRGEEAAPRPVHEDGAALERALQDTVLALARGDAPGMRSGLDALEHGCRRTRDDEPIPKQILLFDTAFHLTLDRARELAGAADIEHAAQQFCWVQSACRKCHEEARKDGLAVGKPPAAP
jgi:hypothetical protein